MGRVEYSEGLSLQRKLISKLIEHPESGSGYLLLVEHPPVITIGRFSDSGNLLLGEDEIRRRGVEVARIERGGDVTYHGPGQLVGYPIISLRDFRLGAKDYVHKLEDVLIRLLERYGIKGQRQQGYPGAWVGSDKVAAIGVYVKRWVTMHGFALNVNTDMTHFDMIVPCGLKHYGVTSIEKLTRSEVPLRDTAVAFAGHFGELFGASMQWRSSIGNIRGGETAGCSPV